MTSVKRYLKSVERLREIGVNIEDVEDGLIDLAERLSKYNDLRWSPREIGNKLAYILDPQFSGTPSAIHATMESILELLVTFGVFIRTGKRGDEYALYHKNPNLTDEEMNKRSQDAKDFAFKSLAKIRPEDWGEIKF